jgi:hypothetical protein
LSNGNATGENRRMVEEFSRWMTNHPRREMRRVRWRTRT